ncbi:MAG TPA: LanC-like protein [Nannocystis sp.]
MTLFHPERHIHPEHDPWDPERVRDWLRRWAAEALAVRARAHWPVHPRDREDAGQAAGPYHTLYFGAAGVWIALIRLAAAGYCLLPAEPAELFAGVLADYDRSPDIGVRVPSWFLGESAILTACCLARRDPVLEDRLAAAIDQNRDNPTRELLWGAPGTMIAALFLHEATGDERWARLFRAAADVLWDSWYFDPALGAWIWQQDLYGTRVPYVGAGHGWAGNLYPLWRGRFLLRDEQQTSLRERTLQGLRQLAVVDGELANWPPVAGLTAKMLVQWCHGAPGIITSLRHAELPEALPLLLAGARLIVAAGPLTKGVSLCHGTDGNGAALLEIYRRTGDPVWLDHARAFAMVALDQAEAEYRRHGQWRYSLWTGDAGLAWFLLDCLDGQSRGLPGFDVLL